LKNIKIARKDIFSFEFFAPFNSLFLEQEKNEKCLKNQRLMKKIAQSIYPHLWLK